MAYKKDNLQLPGGHGMFNLVENYTMNFQAKFPLDDLVMFLHAHAADFKGLSRNIFSPDL